MQYNSNHFFFFFEFKLLDPFNYFFFFYSQLIEIMKSIALLEPIAEFASIASIESAARLISYDMGEVIKPYDTCFSKIHIILSGLFCFVLFCFILFFYTFFLVFIPPSVYFCSH